MGGFAIAIAFNCPASVCVESDHYKTHAQQCTPILRVGVHSARVTDENEISVYGPYLMIVSILLFIASLQLEKLISKNYFLNQSAKEAFKAYTRAYDSHQLKSIFEVSTLDLNKVALSFGFTVPPVVDLSEYFCQFPTNHLALMTFDRLSDA